MKRDQRESRWRADAANQEWHEMALYLVRGGELERYQDFRTWMLNEALDELEQIDPRKAEIVKLRFFAGLTNREISEMVSLSTATVERDWKFARAWLHRRMA